MAKKNRKNTEKYKNIIFYGFMCSGKTTAGKYVARKLGLKFKDTDLEFEKKFGKIKNFVNNYGLKKFRQLEKKIFSKLKKESNMVISCGGGIYPGGDKKNLEIFLDIPWDRLKKRLIKNKDSRPLLKNFPQNEKSIKKLYLKRKKYYRKAKLIIKTEKIKDIFKIIKKEYEN